MHSSQMTSAVWHAPMSSSEGIPPAHRRGLCRAITTAPLRESQHGGGMPHPLLARVRSMLAGRKRSGEHWRSMREIAGKRSMESGSVPSLQTWR